MRGREVQRMRVKEVKRIRERKGGVGKKPRE